MMTGGSPLGSLEMTVAAGDGLLLKGILALVTLGPAGEWVWGPAVRQPIRALINRSLAS